MIFTIGLKTYYEREIAKGGSLFKLGKRMPCRAFPDGYRGGLAFQTYEDAEAFVASLRNQDTWKIFGIHAEWDVDTELSGQGWWHRLLRDVELVALDE